ncbi:MAG: biotin/lipoyl-containing protein [Acidobacteriota bacterium]
MTFTVEINGRPRVVSLEPVGATGREGGRFRVRFVDDPEGAPAGPRDVDVRVTDLGVSLLFDDLRRSVDVAVSPLADGVVLLQFPHVAITAAVGGPRSRSRTAAAATTGEQRVLAPMPGRVIRVLVKPGDEVALRQGLVVVEAMKMENELTSSRPGRVREVAVTEGMSVEAGRLLVVIQ